MRNEILLQYSGEVGYYFVSYSVAVSIVYCFKIVHVNHSNT